MLLFLLIVLLNILFITLSIAWYTLFERKILGLSQLRVGPNKTALGGILQPLLDGGKLIFKEFNLMEMTNKWKIYFFPLVLFLLMMIIWSVIPSFFSFSLYYSDFLFFMLFLSLMVFFLILTAVFSNSKFAFLGGIRSASQSVSYEISLNFLIFSPMVILNSLSFFYFSFFSWNLSLLVFLLWWISCLMECNRAPFDFAEGESELISGFNIEYSSVGFVYIFLSEYGMILFFCILSSFVFFNSFLMFFILFFSFITIRTSYPRYRYDKMMALCWLFILPTSVFFIFIFLYF